VSKEFPSQIDSAPERLHRIEGISDAEQKAFNLLVPKHHELSVKIEDFEEIYGPEEVERDRQAITDKKSRMEKVDSPSHRRAQLLEAILAEQIELSEWFGTEAMTIIPSEYDDLYNGIDLMTEFEKEGYFQYLGMNIDVTSVPGTVKKKLDIIKAKITSGTLGQIKYLRSERSDIMGRMSNIPSFVVGADIRTIHELAELWLTANQTRNLGETKLNAEEIRDLREKAKEAQEKLAKHRTRLLILLQIQSQLEAFINFAQSIKNSEVVGKYQNLKKLIDDIISKSSIQPRQQLENEQDDVYKAILKELEIF
jgi:hypothetical protein